MFTKERYQTNSLNLAAFLLCKDLELVDVDKTNPNKAIFIFQDSPDRELLVRDFLFGKEALVDARRFALTLKELKNKLYTNNY